MPEPPDAPTLPRRRPRLGVRGLMLLIAAVGLAMGLGRFWLANRDPEQAWVTRQLRSFADPDPSARLSAIERLGSVGPGELPRSVPALIAAATGDADPSVRATAAAMLGTVAKKTTPAAPPTPVGRTSPAPQSPLAGAISAALIAAIADPSASVRVEAIRALAAIAPPDAPAPEALIAAIGDDDPSIRSEARQAVRRPWAGPDRIAAALLRRVDEVGIEERTELVTLLSMHDPEAASAFVPLLVEAFHRKGQEPPWTRVPIIEALGRIGPKARPALPELRAFAESGFAEPLNMHYWSIGCEAIAAIDPVSEEARAMIDPLGEHLSTADTVGAYSALLALSRFGPSAWPVLPLLREIAEDPDRASLIRAQALAIVRQIERVDESLPIEPVRPSDDG